MGRCPASVGDRRQRIRGTVSCSTSRRAGLDRPRRMTRAPSLANTGGTSAERAADTSDRRK